MRTCGAGRICAESAAAARKKAEKDKLSSYLNFERNMNCLFLDHTQAALALREKYAFTSRSRLEAAENFRDIGGCVPVVTCNRTEFYFRCDREAALAILRRQFQRSFEEFSFCEGEEAERRLFYLAGGLLSMLIGEDEILGQLKDCYESARKIGATKGMDAAFQAALACGKRLRAETGISSLACSIATLAAREVFSFPKREKVVLLIGGTGKMGGAILKNLLVEENVKIYATQRTHAFSADVLRKNVTPIPYGERYAAADAADVIVSCTASPHLTMQADGVRSALRESKERLFVDLSVPQDIDEAIGRLPRCRLCALDGFRSAAEENNAKKAAAAEKARALCQTVFTEFAAAQGARRFLRERNTVPQEERCALFQLRKEDPSAFLETLKSRFGGGEQWI